jgi:long-subunit fatty acid transport protein
VKSLKIPTVLVVLLSIVSITVPVFAQQSNYSVQFSMVKVPFLRVDYIPVSARPAAMGGAFIGAAQDESTAPINPAGLTYMREAGIALNQHWSQIDYQPPGYGAGPESPESFNAIRFDQTTVGVFVPYRSVSFGIYRQVMLDADFPFETEPFTTNGDNGRLPAYEGRKVNLDYKLIVDAVSIGFQLNRKISIGLSGKLTSLNIKLNEKIFDADANKNTADAWNTDIDVAHRLNKPNFSAGLMTELASDKLVFGIVYNYNPSYDIDSGWFYPGRLDSNREPLIQDNVRVKLDIPDTYGAGFYYIPSNKLGLTFDVVRVLYSQLATIISSTEPALFVPPTTDTFKPNDVTELRLGIEYLSNVPKLGAIPLQAILLRAGLYLDPGQKWRDENGNSDARLLYQDVEGKLRYSVGIGLIITNHLKIDAAAVLASDKIDVVGSVLISVDL